MSCYFRHMKDILDEAGITATRENKREVDQLIHDLVKTTYKDCSATWKEVKARIKGSEREKKRFVEALRKKYKALA